MCNGTTKADCYRYRVFGLPAGRLDAVKKIQPQMKLFLYDFDLKLLYGVYTALSHGDMGLEPFAFGGRYPAQVILGKITVGYDLTFGRTFTRLFCDLNFTVDMFPYHPKLSQCDQEMSDKWLLKF